MIKASEELKILQVLMEAMQRKADIIDEFNRAVDDELRVRVSCKGKGCIGCCHQVVGTQCYEGALIAAALLQSDDVELLEQLRDQGDMQYKLFGDKPMGVDTEASDKAPKLWMDQGVRCALLSDADSCKLYALRPMACWTYYVCTPPADCYPPSGKGVMALDNGQALQMGMDLDVWFLQQLYDIDDRGLAPPLPLGFAVMMGVIMLTKGLEMASRIYLGGVSPRKEIMDHGRST